MGIARALLEGDARDVQPLLAEERLQRARRVTGAADQGPDAAADHEAGVRIAARQLEQGGHPLGMVVQRDLATPRADLRLHRPAQHDDAVDLIRQRRRREPALERHQQPCADRQNGDRDQGRADGAREPRAEAAPAQQEGCAFQNQEQQQDVAGLDQNPGEFGEGEHGSPAPASAVPGANRAACQ